MDDATIQRILARQGAEATPDNVNRIIQFAASNPDVMERYSMGTAPPQMQTGPTGTRDIRGGAGMDDNASLLALDRPQPPIQRTASTQTYEAPPPAPAPPPVARRGGRGGTGAATEPDVGPQGPPQGGGDGEIPWWLKLIPSLLAVGYRGNKTGAPGEPWVPGQEQKMLPAPNEQKLLTGPRAQKQLPAPDEALRLGGPVDQGRLSAPQELLRLQDLREPPPRAPAPYGSDVRKPNTQAPTSGSPAVPLSDPERSSPAGRPSGQSQADVNAVQGSVDLENAKNAAAQEKFKAQLRTEELLRAARQSGRSVVRR